MKTQVEQLAEAARAYIMPLNNPRDGMSTHRFQVYLLPKSGGELAVLWPGDMEGNKRDTMLPGQVSCKRDAYPAFHFALSGCGYSKTYEIARALKQINPELVVEVIRGWRPSLGW